MKKLLFFLVCLTGLKAAAQQAYADHEHCLKSIASNRQKAAADLMNKWFEPLPKGVNLACDDHVPVGRCKLHKKQCAGQCDCSAKMAAESKQQEAGFDKQTAACENAYRKALELEQKHQAETDKKNERLKEPATGIAPSNAKTQTASNQAAAQQQQRLKGLQQTQAYANSKAGLPQTQSVSESLQNFGTALQNYQASRARESERRDNRRLQQNQNAANYIACELERKINHYFVANYPYKFSCISELEPSMRSSVTDPVSMVQGEIDSINLDYKNGQFEKGAAILWDKSYRNLITNNNLQKAGIVDDLFSMYTLTHYLNIYEYGFKEKAELRKNVAKGKYSSIQLLGAGLSALVKNNDTDFAAYCFDVLLNNPVPAYFKKAACLYQGLIIKKQAIAQRDNALLNQAFYLLDRGYAITQDDFLKIGDSYDNGEYTTNYSGLFVSAEYFQLLQLGLMQEITHDLYLKYQLSGQNRYLRMAFDYYYGFPESVAATQGTPERSNLISVKEQKKVAELMDKAGQKDKEGKLAESFAFYLQAAQGGDAEAQRLVGDAYSEGKGTEKDQATAFTWYAKSAEQGNSGGYFGLLGCYYFGDGAPKDVPKAVDYALKAAKQAHRGAQYFLGMAYLNGDGVQKNTDEAAKWLLRAAGQGHEKAQAQLARLENTVTH